MKKRRELDALVNGKLGRRKKGQHHELLNNDSDSSEVEEFSVSDKDVVRKRGSSRACATCLIVFGFIVLVACVIAISGLVFVYVNIESDVRQLRSQLDKVAGQSKSNPEEFQQIHKQQRELEKAITDMRTGNGGILHNRMNITLILKQLKTLNATTHMLSESLAAAPQLKALPSTVNDLKQEIADVGSKLRSLQDSIEELQNNKKVLTDKVDSMKKKLNGMVRVVSGATEKPGTVKTAETGSPEMMQEIRGLSAALTKMNTSTWQQFGVVMARGQQHEVQIAGLRNVTHDFESRLRLVELAGSTRPEYNLSSVMQQAVNSVKEELLNLSESAGESAVSALRADITALNTSLQNINTVQKSNVRVGSAEGTPAGVTSLSSYMSSTDDKLQQLQTSLASVVYNITAMDTRIKSHEGRLSVVEISIKSTHDITTDDTRTTDSSTHMSQSEQTNDQSDQHTGQTSNADQIDKKSSLKLDTNKDALVGTDQTGSTNTQDILVHEGLPRGRTGSGTENVNPVATKTTPQTTHLKSAEDLAVQFKMWDRDINGHVSYSDIVFYLGAFVPAEQSFKKYDTNGDGEYSLSELNIAFGFDSDSSEAVTEANSTVTTMSERDKP